MIQADLVRAIRRGLEKDRRPPDGKLHCSSDILGSLRHAQLKLAGAPTIQTELVDDIRLKTGTMWHELLRDYFINDGLALMAEVRLGKYLPEGWDGTADWLFWDFERRCFVLGDLKTTKGEGMYYIEQEGAKADHIAQLSAYYHALRDSGMPLRKGFFVLYLPMNQDSDGRLERVEPLKVECVPMARDVLHGIMNERWSLSKNYLVSVAASVAERRDYQAREHPETYVTDGLAPPLEREQKVFWDRKSGRYDVKLVPSWRTRFCPFDAAFCDCSTQGTTKVGHFTYNEGEIVYEPRRGFEEVAPISAPSSSDFERKLRAA